MSETAPRYWIEPDGHGDDTIWHDSDNPFGPDPIVRRCDVSAEAWDLLCRGIPTTPRQAEPTDQPEEA